MTNFQPLDEVILNAGLDLFSKISSFMTAIIAAVVIMRVVFLQATFSGASGYSELFIDLISYFGLSGIFPMLVKLMMEVIATLSKKIALSQMNDVHETVDKFMSALIAESPGAQILAKVGDLAVLMFAQSTYTIMIGLLLAVAPIVLFCSTVLNLSFGMRAYFQSLLAMALWPLLWNVLGALGKSMFPYFSESPFRTTIYWCVILLLQVFSPIFCIILFRSMSSSGAISSAVGSAANMGGGL